MARNKSILHRIKVLPWTQFADSPVRQAQSKITNTGIGITIIFSRNEYADFFHFATHNENIEMQERYSSYADCLVQFIHHFYDKASKLINTVCEKKNRLILPDRVCYSSDNSYPITANFNIDQFMSETQPSRFFIYSEGVGEVFLSQKELHCVQLLALGKTAREIGNISFRSKRTIETHINNVKEKLGLPSGSSKADLIAEIYRSGFELHEVISN